MSAVLYLYSYFFFFVSVNALRKLVYETNHLRFRSCKFIIVVLVWGVEITLGLDPDKERSPMGVGSTSFSDTDREVPTFLRSFSH